ncbi:MAG: FecR family protein [Candidatus Parcubacteria bacterium]|nr:FecR family protein [Candidatus Parcubacteria bacterium]
MMYYYKRKSNPFKWVIVALIFMVAGVLVYWFYINYFSKIELNKPAPEEDLNNVEIIDTKIIGGEISLLQGDVMVDIAAKGYEKSIDKAVLHQGDKIKTGENSLAVLGLDDGTKIRLGANTEIVLDKLDEDNVLINLLKGRIYNNITTVGQYQVLVLKAKITALGTKFEIIVNDKTEYLAVLVMENKVNLDIMDNEDILMSSRLDTNEKALIDFKAAKKDMFKIDTFDQQVLAKEAWYKWNFDQDNGVVEVLPEQEPDFEVISDSLILKSEQKIASIKLSWSPYTLDNFSLYKLVRSEQHSDLKFPDDEVIKSSANKDLATFTDETVSKGKQYYYRVCVVKTSAKVACGNVVDILVAEQDSTPPAIPQLQAIISVSGVSLTWTANIEEDFKEYRILKSITDPNPSFPTAGYLIKKLQSNESYLDKEVNITSPGYVYYRVCSLDTAQNFSCSNVIIVENGAVK